MKKILFYGNCQLAVLSKMLESQSPKFNEKYKILKAPLYNLAHVWKPEIGIVAPFMYQEHTKYGVATKDTLQSLKKITDDADIIIFQNFKPKNKDRPIELTTEFIYERHKKNKMIICIPSYWFSGYMTKVRSTEMQMASIFMWLVQKKMNNYQILDWLLHCSDPNISTLLQHNATQSINELKTRELEESSIYDNFISIIDIFNVYKSIFLNYTCSHPTQFYFNILYNRLVDFLDKEILAEIPDSSIDHAGPAHEPYPLDFCFFRENFPNINGCDILMYKNYTGGINRLDIHYVNKQIELMNKLTSKQISKIQEEVNILNS